MPKLWDSTEMTHTKRFKSFQRLDIKCSANVVIYVKVVDKSKFFISWGKMNIHFFDSNTSSTMWYEFRSCNLTKVFQKISENVI